jgi:hypothetical protein
MPLVKEKPSAQYIAYIDEVRAAIDKAVEGVQVKYKDDPQFWNALEDAILETLLMSLSGIVDPKEMIDAGAWRAKQILDFTETYAKNKPEINKIAELLINALESLGKKPTLSELSAVTKNSTIFSETIKKPLKKEDIN